MHLNSVHYAVFKCILTRNVPRPVSNIGTDTEVEYFSQCHNTKTAAHAFIGQFWSICISTAVKIDSRHIPAPVLIIAAIKRETLALLICHRCEGEATGTWQLIKLHWKCLQLSQLTGTCRKLGSGERRTFLLSLTLRFSSPPPFFRGMQEKRRGACVRKREARRTSIDPTKT